MKPKKIRGREARLTLEGKILAAIDASGRVHYSAVDFDITSLVKEIIRLVSMHRDRQSGQ